MKQLVELRHNPLAIPAAGDKSAVPLQELIFITSQIGYKVGFRGESQQEQETIVFRCMATEAAMANAAANLLFLLAPATRAKIQAIDFEAEREKA